jgi:hypothetical protein
MNEELSEGIKLVRGNPTAEELAAAIAVVEAMLAEEQAAAKKAAQASGAKPAKDSSSEV